MLSDWRGRHNTNLLKLEFVSAGGAGEVEEGEGGVENRCSCCGGKQSACSLGGLFTSGWS